MNGLAVSIIDFDFQQQDSVQTNFQRNGLQLDLIGMGIVPIFFRPLYDEQEDSTIISEIRSSKMAFHGQVNGVAISGLGNVNRAHYNGISADGISGVKSGVNGLSVALANCNTLGIHNGMQLSLLGNHATVHNGLQLSGVRNVSTEIKGVQLGLINQLFSGKGVQIGVYNHAPKTSSFQLGLWNTNANRSFPFINW